MNADTYQQIQSLTDALIAAGESSDDSAYARRYAELERLCAHATDDDGTDPVLLETLADFTLDDEQALDIYDEALGLAITASDRESQLSILLAIAERYRDLDDGEAAASYAAEAVKAAEDVEATELRDELAELLQSLGRSN